MVEIKGCWKTASVGFCHNTDMRNVTVSQVLNRHAHSLWIVSADWVACFHMLVFSLKVGGLHTAGSATGCLHSHVGYSDQQV